MCNRFYASIVVAFNVLFFHYDLIITYNNTVYSEAIEMNNEIYNIIKDTLMTEFNYFDYQIREVKGKTLTVPYPVSLEIELPLTVTVLNENHLILSSSMKYENIQPDTVKLLEDLLRQEDITLKSIRVKDSTTRLDLEESMVIDDPEQITKRFKSVFVNFNYAVCKTFQYSVQCGAEPDVGLLYFSKYDENGEERWYDIVLSGDIVSTGRNFIIFKDFKQESSFLLLCAKTIKTFFGYSSEFLMGIIFLIFRT